jgi:uncharacterized membrane protein YkgB
MNSSFLLIVVAIGVVCSVVAIYYIAGLKNSFAGVIRLARPWLLLECGVVSLIVAALTIPWMILSTSVSLLRLVQIVAVVVAAFFVLTAMAMMKQAWTIKEGD